MQPITANITTPGEFREEIEKYTWHVKDNNIYAFQKTDRSVLPDGFNLEFATDIPISGFNVYPGTDLDVRFEIYDHDRKQWQEAGQSPDCTWQKLNEFFRTCRVLITRRSIDPAKAVKEVGEIIGYVHCSTNERDYPLKKIRSQGGIKKDIIDLCLNLAAPDDDCMLSDFLHALQFVLDKHQWQSRQDREGWVRLETRNLNLEYILQQIKSQLSDETYRVINQKELMNLIEQVLPAPPQQALTPKDN